MQMPGFDAVVGSTDVFHDAIIYVPEWNAKRSTNKPFAKYFLKSVIRRMKFCCGASDVRILEVLDDSVVNCPLFHIANCIECVQNVGRWDEG